MTIQGIRKQEQVQVGVANKAMATTQSDKIPIPVYDVNTGQIKRGLTQKEIESLTMTRSHLGSDKMVLFSKLNQPKESMLFKVRDEMPDEEIKQHTIEQDTLSEKVMAI